ncbi:MAG: tail fiber protein [Dethiosulfatibacter sp.]|nr:tail fiber protein [Dethiosulfatibacter sp.]
MQNVGEIKLFAYDDVPCGYLECRGQKLEIVKYPKLYMMIGSKYGDCDERHFYLPNLSAEVPTGMRYCIAYMGEVPRINDEGEEK